MVAHRKRNTILTRVYMHILARLHWDCVCLPFKSAYKMALQTVTCYNGPLDSDYVHCISKDCLVTASSSTICVVPDVIHKVCHVKDS